MVSALGPGCPARVDAEQSRDNSHEPAAGCCGDGHGQADAAPGRGAVTIARRPQEGPVSEPQEIHVVSKVPAAILNVLQQQFKLMQGWLKPIYEETQGQSEEIQQLPRLRSRTERIQGYR